MSESPNKAGIGSIERTICCFPDNIFPPSKLRSIHINLYNQHEGLNALDSISRKLDGIFAKDISKKEMIDCPKSSNLCLHREDEASQVRDSHGT